MKDKIKILLVDDHSIVRNGLKMLLELDGNFQVCGEASTLKEGIELAGESNPDIILLDLKLSDGDGISGCINIKRRYPHIKIIILTAFAQEQMVIEAVMAGSDGYLLKNIESEELIKSILSVYEGNSVLDPLVTDSVFNKIKQTDIKHQGDTELSPKEVEIVEMISLGKPNKEIAANLNISDKTVRNYISNIFKKLNVSNRTEAARYWIRKNTLK